jgi:hypothetical protein
MRRAQGDTIFKGVHQERRNPLALLHNFGSFQDFQFGMMKKNVRMLLLIFSKPPFATCPARLEYPTWAMPVLYALRTYSAIFLQKKLTLKSL